MTDLVTTTTDTPTNSIEALDSIMRNKPANTYMAYKHDQDTFIRLTGKDLFQASNEDVSEYIKGLYSKEYASATIARKIYSISKVFSVLVSHKYRLDNPIKALQEMNKNIIPKQVRRIHQVLTKGDIDSVKKLTKNKTALLIELLFSTGARISEILSIKTHNLKPNDAERSMVEVIGKGNKARTLFIANNLIQRIQKAFTHESEYLIHSGKGNRANRINEYKKIRALFKNVTGKKAHPHQLRHLYATTQIVAKKHSVKAVSDYLGHKSTSTTLDMYCTDKLSSKNAVLE